MTLLFCWGKGQKSLGIIRHLPFLFFHPQFRSVSPFSPSSVCSCSCIFWNYVTFYIAGNKREIFCGLMCIKQISPIRAGAELQPCFGLQFFFHSSLTCQVNNAPALNLIMSFCPSSHLIFIITVQNNTITCKFSHGALHLFFQVLWEYFKPHKIPADPQRSLQHIYLLFSLSTKYSSTQRDFLSIFRISVDICFLQNLVRKQIVKRSSCSPKQTISPVFPVNLNMRTSIDLVLTNIDQYWAGEKNPSSVALWAERFLLGVEGEGENVILHDLVLHFSCFICTISHACLGTGVSRTHHSTSAVLLWVPGLATGCYVDAERPLIFWSQGRSFSLGVWVDFFFSLLFKVFLPKRNAWTSAEMLAA